MEQNWMGLDWIGLDRIGLDGGQIFSLMMRYILFFNFCSSLFLFVISDRGF